MAAKSILYCYMDKLATEIAKNDPVTIAERLQKEHLISEILLDSVQVPSKSNYHRASELLMTVTALVTVAPAKFEVFLGILSEFEQLQELVSVIRKDYQEQGAE